jgi:alpha-amylase
MVQTTGGGGFRLDAIKHMDRKFLLQWVSISKMAAITLPVVFMVSYYADQTGAHA